MKRFLSRLITILLLLALLPGCAEETSQTPIGSHYWTSFPTLGSGFSQQEVLSAAPWNCGRLEATSHETMAETEQGYYLVYMNQLFYADKQNLSNWVPVCSQPDCKHRDMGSCSSILLDERIVIKDNRIFTTVNSGTYPQIYDNGCSVAVMSFLGDGTDMKLEYVLEAGVYDDSAGISAMLYSDQMLYNAVALQRDGTWTGYLYRVSPEGVETLTEVEDFDRNGLVVSTPAEIVNGVHLFQSTLLDPSGRFFYYYENGELKHFDIAGFPGVGGYLSNGILRCMKSGEGYYDVNLETGEKTFLEKQQIENSRSRIILPNCILETTLIGHSSALGNTAVQIHQMSLFNGTRWQSVLLPKELENSNENLTLSVMGVASDRIFIACRDSRYQNSEYGFRFSVYQILLDSQTCELTYCGDICRP